MNSEEKNKQEEIITPQEYLQRQLQEELEALETLPGNFEECTYHLGPLNQAVYVCLTCEKSDERQIKSKAGICYPCSIACHSKHELLELFNKRGFRCECGTHKFDKKCNLENFKPVKGENGEVLGDVDTDGWRNEVKTNTYSENFNGIYCYCKRPYDPMVETDDMYECIDCQNWYHKKCIKIPEIDDEDDFICSICVLRHPILLNYCKTRKFSTFVQPSLNNEPPELKVTLDTISNPLFSKGESTQTSVEKEELNLNAENKDEEKTLTNVINSSINTNKRERSDNSLSDEEHRTKKGCNEVTDDSKVKDELKDINREGLVPPSDKNNHIDSNQSDKCKCPIMPEFGPEPLNLLAKPGWRSTLCRCEQCMIAYTTQDMLHLIDEEEVYTVEPDDDVPGGTIYDAGMEALSTLPRSQAIDLVNHVDLIRKRIKEFVTPFAKSGKVITKDDVLEFFGKRRQ